MKRYIISKWNGAGKARPQQRASTYKYDLYVMLYTLPTRLQPVGTKTVGSGWFPGPGLTCDGCNHGINLSNTRFQKEDIRRIVGWHAGLDLVFHGILGRNGIACKKESHITYRTLWTRTNHFSFLSFDSFGPCCSVHSPFLSFLSSLSWDHSGI